MGLLGGLGHVTPRRSHFRANGVRLGVHLHPLKFGQIQEETVEEGEDIPFERILPRPPVHAEIPVLQHLQAATNVVNGPRGAPEVDACCLSGNKPHRFRHVPRLLHLDREDGGLIEEALDRIRQRSLVPKVHILDKLFLGEAIQRRKGPQNAHEVPVSDGHLRPPVS